MFETGAVTLLDSIVQNLEQMTFLMNICRSYEEHVTFDTALDFKFNLATFEQASANATFQGGASAAMDTGEEQLYPNDDQGDWTYFGEPDDWREWTERAVNA
ncbi:hypothetical protein AK812_SmicGene23460 [Symbiodinium microadriaticum]|uniref:Uncharacterized protein n=1 Tax=Symbiodinium microadriaticum TaxID=2951 RepID=A0A1Q9DHA9_SYMMI|nr:hypothetical protein AK812_SmicGene23460 [Symbiodinium microadriaticum]